MQTFIQWAEANNKSLEIVTDAEQGEDAVEEQGKRTGYSGNYPPAYVRAHYPHKYFNPTKATADLDKEQMKD